jgi:hypothetical protein
MQAVEEVNFVIYIFETHTWCPYKHDDDDDDDDEDEEEMEKEEEE